MKNAGEMPTPFLAPSIDLPTVKTAAMADLPDDEPVIGVVVNGKARAYSIKALSPIGRHVVNDVISHEAVSITYCDRTDCARVFTGKNEGRPLQIIQGGFSEGLLLRSDGRFYRQDDGTSLDKSAGPLPYAIQKHDRTTWKQWRQAHPDTEVYAGIPSLAEPIPEVKAP